MVVDKYNMLKVLEQFPQQCKDALTLPKGMSITGNITSILVCGMGGSAIGGDLLKSYLSDSNLPVFVNRNYGIPRFVDSTTLVFAISYSGNTEETLEAVKMAKEKQTSDNILNIV